MSHSVRCLSLAIVFLVGCDGDSARGADRVTARARPAAQARPVSPTPVPAPPPAPALRSTPLGDRLASEATTRPARAVRASGLVQALAAEGVSVAPPRQVLASPIGARYCESTVSPSGLVLAVCEFESAAGARQGAERSRALFDELVPKRLLVGNDNTLLTLAGNAALESDREAELARSAFLALTPAALGD